MPPPRALAGLPKPLLFALYGAAAGLVGALALGEVVWFALKPPPPAPPPPPPPPPARMAFTASPAVQMYVGGSNTLAVSVARAEFDGPVAVRLDDAPPGVTADTVTVPAGQTAATVTVAAAPGTSTGVRSAKLVAEAVGRPLRADAALTIQVDTIGRPKADVVFVLDGTASMRFAVNGVQRGITRFVDDIARSQLDARFGMIAFYDRFTPDGVSDVLTFDDVPFTTDAGRFGERVGRVKEVSGGTTFPESSLDALTDAAKLPFRQGATRVLVLITDAAPLIPDVRTQSLQEAAGVLKAEQIRQLHLITRTTDRINFYESLRRMAEAPGRSFDLERLAGSVDGSELAAILPDLGKDIAVRTIASSPAGRPEVSVAPPPAAVALPTVAAVQSSEGFEAGSGGRLVFAVAAWTGAIAALVCLALAAGQFHYLKSSLPVGGVLLAGAGGLAAGLVGGAAGQGLFLAAPDSAALEKVFRLIGWAALGGLAGAGLSFFIPNLKPWQGLLGGAVGGAAGAVGFLAVAALGSDLAGRLAGGVALGFFIGLMVAAAEAAFRTAWLEVWHGPREMITVNLGAEPVRVGGDARQCTVWARGAAPVAARCWLRDGAVVWAEGGRESAVGAGFEKTLGSVRVVVRTGGGAPAAPPPEAPRRPAAGPAPAYDPFDDLPSAKPAAPAADVCPYCKGRHPGKPGRRYCPTHDRSY